MGHRLQEFFRFFSSIYYYRNDARFSPRPVLEKLDRFFRLKRVSFSNCRELHFTYTSIFILLINCLAKTTCVITFHVQ